MMNPVTVRAALAFGRDGRLPQVGNLRELFRHCAGVVSGAEFAEEALPALRYFSRRLGDGPEARWVTGLADLVEQVGWDRRADAIRVAIMVGVAGAPSHPPGGEEIDPAKRYAARWEEADASSAEGELARLLRHGWARDDPECQRLRALAAGHRDAARKLLAGEGIAPPVPVTSDADPGL